MATRGANLPIERSYLIKAWFAVAAIVIAASAVVWLSMTVTGGTPAGGIGPATVGGGPAETKFEQIVVNGNVCGQCR